MNDNVVSLHKGMKVNRPDGIDGRNATVPITALLYSLMIFGSIKPDQERLVMVKGLFASGLLVNAFEMTATVPTYVADWIDEFSPAQYGQAAAALQMMNLTDCSALDACAAVMNKE